MRILCCSYSSVSCAGNVTNENHDDSALLRAYVGQTTYTVAMGVVVLARVWCVSRADARRRGNAHVEWWKRILLRVWSVNKSILLQSPSAVLSMALSLYCARALCPDLRASGLS